jgi:DNA helicase-2/ATP-dependent DNA helicase PcrA
VEAVFKSAWVNEGFVSREHEEMRFAAGLAVLQRILQQEKTAPSQPGLIEKSFSFTLGSVKIAGRMDRVDFLPDGGAVIIDYKSTEVLHQEDADRKARESLQLKIYAAAWQKTEGRLPERLELHFLDSDRIGRVKVEPKDVDAVEDKILETAVQIRLQEFPSKPSAWTCGYCPYRTLCPDAET